MIADVLAAGLRALGFIGLFQAAGAIFFMALFGTASAISARINTLAMISAVTAIACFIAQQSLEAARFVGELGGVLDTEWLREAWMSRSGGAQALRLTGLSLIVAGATRRSSHGLIAAGVGAAFALLSFLVSGHTSVHPLRTALAPLLGIHIFVAAFWFGSLLPLVLLVRHEPTDHAAVVLGRYSRVAGWLVPLILVAGALMLWVLASDMSVLTRTYGQLVLLKLIAFALLMGLAARNRWRLVPLLASGSAAAGAVLRRSIAIEIVLIGGVLALTAVLTLLFSPEA
jgi:copper resistance protein D